MIIVDFVFQFKLSPIQTAIELQETTNKKLNSGIEHQLTDDKARIDQLGKLGQS